MTVQKNTASCNIGCIFYLCLQGRRKRNTCGLCLFDYNRRMEERKERRLYSNSMLFLFI